jgi:uncharacterized membrane protein YoaK (UPF0700 family)
LVPAPWVSHTCAVQTLLVVLSVIAGCTDVIGFLGLNGLFTAHITGNLVILAAHVVSGGVAEPAPMLSVPVFIAMVGLTMLLGASFEARGRSSLHPLLLLHFLCLAGFLILCVAAVGQVDPNAIRGVLAGMLGVAAMAVQNALVQIAIKGAPSTAVMTSNVTRFATDIGAILLHGDPVKLAEARNRAMETLPVIVGFAAGCALGAACQAAFDLWSLVLPVCLALVSLAIGFAVEPGRRAGE